MLCFYWRSIVNKENTLEMSSEITYSSLKIASHMRESEERKATEKKRQLLYLISQYLKDEGIMAFGKNEMDDVCYSWHSLRKYDVLQYYLLKISRNSIDRYFDTAQCFNNEAHLSNQYQTCDNIDLATIVQDYETYYYLRFQKYPKICKKVVVEECKKGFPKKSNVQESESPPRMASIQNDSPKENKLHITKSLGKSTTTTVQKCLKNAGSLSDMDLIVLPLTSNGFINPQKNNNQSNAQTVTEKLLKPLAGCGIYSAEWKEFAEVISKEICVSDLNVHWDDIMGLEEAKRLLKEAVVYPTKYPELFSGVLAPWKGLLLYGPPGTGKTLLAKAVATECKTTFFNISASSIVSKWRGDSEKLVRVMFELARYHAPSTIFLDEIDALASHRDAAGEHEGSRRLKAELLIQLDGLANSDDRVFLLATSNLPWELDAAILRRLEKRILVDLPNIKAREAMIHHYLPPVVIEKPALLCELDYKLLAHTMGGYSGSDIKLVCKEAAMNTMRTAFSILETNKSGGDLPNLNLEKITTEDIKKALQITKPSAAHLASRYQKWQREFGST